MSAIFGIAQSVGNKQGMSWLPDSTFAAKFRKFVSTNTVRNVTAPCPPLDITLIKKKDGISESSWSADADIESEIKCFNIYKMTNCL